MQEILAKAPKFCTGCLGGCKSIMSQGAVVNEHFCPMANETLLLKAGYKCDAYFWVTYGGKGERYEHLAIRIMAKTSEPAVAPFFGPSEEELAQMGPHLRCVARCTGGRMSPGCCLLPHLVVPVMMIAAMIGLVSYGIYLNVLVAQLPPAKVFSTVGGGCRILDVDHSERKQSNNKIFDRYTFDFTEVADGGQFQSITEEFKRDRNQLDVQIPASFTVGQNVTCWQPSGVEDVASLERLYTCGNPECVRVLTPYDQHSLLQSWGKWLTVSGVAAGVIGITAVSLIVFYYRVCKAEQMRMQSTAFGVQVKPSTGYGVLKT